MQFAVSEKSAVRKRSESADPRQEGALPSPASKHAHTPAHLHTPPLQFLIKK